MNIWKNPKSDVGKPIRQKFVFSNRTTYLITLLLIIFISGCSLNSNPKVTSQTTPVSGTNTEDHNGGQLPNTSSNPEASAPTSETPSICVTPSNKPTSTPAISEPSELMVNAKGQYEVRSYSEFIRAVDSDREILILSGDFSDNEPEYTIRGVTNLTITGIPKDGAEYAEFAGLHFEGCDKIRISNIAISYEDHYWNGALGFINCHSIKIDHCRLNSLPNEYGNHGGSGIKLNDVEDFTCTDTIIEKFERNIDLFLTDDATFTACTMDGGPLQIGDGLNDGPCSNILLEDCTLLCESGICATWSNYVPIADKSGYEIEPGTEEWQERRFLTAIMYSDQISSWSGIRYKNTYDGSRAIFSEGNFLKLAEKITSLENVKAFPSIDYVAAPDADWNQYYDFYGTPETIKLVINILEDGPKQDIDEMMKKVMELNVMQEITAYGCPVTLAYRDASRGEIHSDIIAYAEFTNSGLEAFLNGGNYSNWEPYCSVVVPEWSPVSAPDFFKIRDNISAKYLSLSPANLFLTEAVKISFEGQMFSRLFMVNNSRGCYDVYAAESFSGMGDFMHYNTDLIVMVNVMTCEVEIVLEDSVGKCALENQNTPLKDSFTNAMSQLTEEMKTKVKGELCSDVVLFLTGDSSENKVDFLFLTAEKIDSNDVEYYFRYYIATYERETDKITKVEHVTLPYFKDVLSLP